MKTLMRQNMESLPGITFTVDDENNRVIIVLDKEKYAEIWEDFYDGLLLSLTDKEETISLAEVKAQLKEASK